MNNKSRGAIRFNLNMFYRICLTSLAVIVVLGIGTYVFTPGSTSDYVEGLFWSDASLQSGRLLNPDYAYAYAIPYGSNLLFLPFVAVLGTTQLANSLGMGLFFLVMTGTVVFFLKALCDDIVEIVVGTAIILLAFRSEMGLDLLHHVLFYQLGFVCFMGMIGALIRLMNGQKRNKYLFIFMAYTIWSGANGMVTITLAVLPVLVAVIYTEVTGKLSRRFMAETLLMITVGTLIGFGMYKYSMRGIIETGYLENASTYDFLPVNEWIENIRELPNAWFNMFVIFNPEGKRIASALGVETVVSIFVSLIAAVSPIIYIIRFRKLDNNEKMIFFGCIMIWVPCIAQFVFLRGPVPRLLFSGICANFILLALFTISIKRKLRTVEQKTICLLVAVLTTVFSIQFSVKADWQKDIEVIDELRHHNLTYGVATFWNANINTANSGGDVKVRPVLLSHGMVCPFYYQSQHSWYNLPSDVTDWFLLLTEDEYQSVITGMSRTLIDSCKEVLDIQNYHVLVFSADQWNTCVLGRKFIYNFNEDEWAKECEPIEGKRYIHDGGVSFGPGIKVDNGSDVNVTIQGNRLSYAEISVYSIQDNTKKSCKPVYSQRTDTEISFRITAETDLKAFEIAISNPSDDAYAGDIILSGETVEVVE